MSTPQTIYLSDYRVPDFCIDKTHLLVHIDDEVTTVTSTLHMRRNPDSEAQSAPLVLHGVELDLVHIFLDEQELHQPAFSLCKESLTVHNVPDAFVLRSVVHIKPQHNTSLEGLYKSATMYCTQCEAEGFRKITYYLDRPDVMSVFTTRIEAPAARYPVLLSNGNPVASGNNDTGWHWVEWHDPFPKPAYLFAMVAGDLSVREDSFTTCSGRDVAIKLYVEPKDLDKCDHAIDSLKRSMRWDEEVYGREYDLDIFMIVAVDDFNMGAMENKGLNIFNTSCVLANPRTTTDAAFQRVEAVVAHEYFHNWSGNRVTCRDWFQLSLKEGFTVYRDSEFSADMGSRAVKRIDDVSFLRTAQFAEDAGPLAHPVRPASYIEISNFYTLTVYEKGAEVVRMINTLIGPDMFRRGSDLYFDRHDGCAVTCDDFVAAMEDISGKDLSQFKRWYSQAGTPHVSASGHYDAQAKTYTLTLAQSSLPSPGQAEKEPFHIPVHTALIGEGGELSCRLEGDNVEGTDWVLELTNPQQTFVFHGVNEAPVPSLLRGFSAPVKLSFPYTQPELRFLMTRDGDPFNRWEAGQNYALQIIHSLLEDYAAGRALQLDAAFVAAFADLLDNKSLDDAFLARMILLPSEAYIAETCEVVDVHAIHTVRQFIRRTLANKLRAKWLAIYHGRRMQNAYEPSAQAIAQRSLVNTALAYLMADDQYAEVDLCYQQFNDANNMTDQFAALSCLVNSGAAHEDGAAAEALEQFYRQWSHEPLVVNMWLSVQAGEATPGALARVKKLLDHSAFDAKNPNKLRAVIAVFAGQNPTNFHAVDGEGYAFLADRVIALNKVNPQIAARLVVPLTKWRRYPEASQRLMRAALERILAVDELSKDIFEIVSKGLA
jgi:aminopeptidase N